VSLLPFSLGIAGFQTRRDNAHRALLSRRHKRLSRHRLRPLEYCALGLRAVLDGPTGAKEAFLECIAVSRLFI
jgi:hypothetical protein